MERAVIGSLFRVRVSKRRRARRKGRRSSKTGAKYYSHGRNHGAIHRKGDWGAGWLRSSHRSRTSHTRAAFARCRSIEPADRPSRYTQRRKSESSTGIVGLQRWAPHSDGNASETSGPTVAFGIPRTLSIGLTSRHPAAPAGYHCQPARPARTIRTKFPNRSPTNRSPISRLAFGRVAGCGRRVRVCTVPRG